MKKILAFVLALCLTLSLSVVAFAGPDSPSIGGPDSPTPGNPSNPGSNVGITGGSSDKNTYSATTADGRKVTFVPNIASSTEEPVQALAELGVNTSNAVVMRLELPDGVTDPLAYISCEFYVGDIPDDAIIIIYDAWEVRPDVTFKRNGARVTVTAPAGVLQQYPYVAFVSAAEWNVVDVENPSQDTVTDDEPEKVGDDVPNVDVEPEDTTPAPAPDTTTPAPAPAEDNNPKTGVALAVIPMIVSAAAAVISKRR